MKKLLSIVVLALLTITLCATEKAVIKAHEDYRRAFIALDMDKVLALTHPEFVTISSQGRKIDFARTKQLAKVVELTKKTTISLADIMEMTSIVKGQPFTDEMRKNAEAMEKTEDGKQLMAFMKPMIDTLKDQTRKMQDDFAADLKTFKLISCTVKGDSAKLIYTMHNSTDNIDERTETDWVKVNGKWLMKKSVSTKL